MQRLIGLVVCVAVAIAALASTSFAAVPAKLISAKDKPIADQYIVVLKDGPSSSATSVAAAIGAQPRYVYNAALNGFAARLTPRQLTALQNNPHVAYIEQDAEVAASTTQSVPAGLWGLDRIDQPNLPLDGSYTYNTTASNVTVYVIDSGIYPQHIDFGGRAKSAYDALGGNGIDCYGRGTHLAGTIGSATYGVAKEAQLRGVRVLDCYGYGTLSSVLAGMDYVRTAAVKPAVAIMVVNSSVSASIEYAATNLSNAGVYLVVHAGNANADACSYSPTRMALLLAVGATTTTDTRASWSNYGLCVDIYAPGVSVLSTWYGTYNATRTVSGTEIAAAHVAGCAAKYKATFGDNSQATINQWLTTNATAVNGIRIMYCPL